MKELLYPKKTVYLPYTEAPVDIVAIPQFNILQGSRNVEEYLKKNNLSGTMKESFSIDGQVSFESWESYLRDANIVMQYTRKAGTVSFDDGDIDYGKPQYDSIDSYLMDADENTHVFLFAQVMKFREDIMPDLSELTEEKEKQIIDELVKKNGNYSMNGLSSRTLKKLITTLASQVYSLQKESGASST